MSWWPAGAAFAMGLGAWSAHAAEPPAASPAACLALGDAGETERAVRCWVAFLAGPELRGRDNGSEGGRRAREALVGAFAHLGLAPAGTDAYLQPLPAGANVLGLLEGSDPARRGEVIVVGAHYDHLGELGREVHYGADDNASGVAVLVELARALSASGRRPARSVLFAAFDAEEPPDYLTRRMGSQWFLDHPVLPRERWVAMVCMDLMGGDLWEGFASPLFLMGLETFESPARQDLAAIAGGRQGVAVATLHLRAIEDLPGGRQAFSDYGPFWDARIPVLFLSTGRSPHYHQPTDLPATLRYDKLAQGVGVAAGLTGWLAGSAPRPAWAPEQPLRMDTLETVAGLLRTALGRTAGQRASQDLGALGALAIRQDLARLAVAAGSLGSGQVLDAALAARVVTASLRLQCLLAPDEEMPAGACLLL